MSHTSTSQGVEFSNTLQRALGNTDDNGSVATGQWSPTQWERFNELGASSLLVSEDRDGIGASLEDFYPVAVGLGEVHCRFPAIESIVAQWLASECNIELNNAGFTTMALCSTSQYDHPVDQPLLLIEVPFGRNADTIVVVHANGNPDGRSQIAVVSPDNTEIQQSENLAREARDTLRVRRTVAFTETAISWHRLLELLALGRAAQMVGIMQTLVRLTADYVSNRTQFGRPLSRFQAVQHNLATMYAETMAASVATRAALRGRPEQLEPFDACAAITQTRAAATKIAACSHQAHGAMGFTDEYALADYSRRLWAWRDEYQSEAWWQHRLGALVVNQDETLLQLLSKGSG